MVACQDQSIQDEVGHNLLVAQHVLRDHGGIGQSGQMTWAAVNQFTKRSSRLVLPVMSVGGQAFSGNRDPRRPTPVVDEVQSLAGCVATVFQRMDSQGNMLRVATNVLGKDGKRAVGTYIPATNPDGKRNPVVSALMNGQTYRGMAFVVDKWYVTSYAPLRDASGGIVGAVFVGIEQEKVAALRKAVIDTKIGETGYIWVLGGKADTRGCYVISKNGERDGENIWDTKDSRGTYCIREMINGALKLKPGETFEYRYPWKSPGENVERWKVASITYYEPWDWVIGASCYEDELLSGVGRIGAFGRLTLWILALTGIAATVMAAVVFRRFSNQLTDRIVRLTRAAGAMALGDIRAAREIVSASEDRVA